MNYSLEINGDIQDCLGRNNDSTIKLSKPLLIQQIIDEVKVAPRLVNEDTPGTPSKILRRFESEPKFNQYFHYRRIIGKLNFLGKENHPDLSYAVHQFARFCENPRVSHGQDVEY